MFEWTLHLAVCLLLYVLFRRLHPDPAERFTPLAVALIAFLHPYFFGLGVAPGVRPDLVVALALIAFLLAALQAGAYSSLVFPLLAAALCVGRTAVMLPVWLVSLWLRYRATRPRPPRARLLFFGCAGIVAAFLLYPHVLPWLQGHGTASLATMRPHRHFFPEVPALWLQTLRYMVWPCPPAAMPAAAPASINAAGMIALLAWMGLAVAVRRRYGLLSFGLSWVVIAFFPVTPWRPLDPGGAHRYPYLASLGFAMILAWMLSRFHSPRARAWGLAGVCVLRAATALVCAA